MGVPATGKAVAFGGMTFVRLIDGKIAERWGIADMPGLMAQLAGGPGSSH
jgi:predicted ester cyclase